MSITCFHIESITGIHLMITVEQICCGNICTRVKPFDTEKKGC